MIPSVKEKKQHSHDIKLVDYGYSGKEGEAERAGGGGGGGVVNEYGEWCCLLSLEISSPD